MIDSYNQDIFHNQNLIFKMQTFKFVFCITQDINFNRRFISCSRGDIYVFCTARNSRTRGKDEQSSRKGNFSLQICNLSGLIKDQVWILYIRPLWSNLQINLQQDITDLKPVLMLNSDFKNCLLLAVFQFFFAL